MRAWLAANPEKRNESQYKWRNNNPEKFKASRARWLKKRIQNDPLYYTNKQRKNLPSPTRPCPDVCEACGQIEHRVHKSGKRFELSLDHCHVTGRFKGWLCGKCNTTAGDTGTIMKAFKDWRTTLSGLFPVGTRSVLFGAHAFWLHPVFVWMAWWKLYGFPVDPRLYFAFFLHDLGYFGKRNMDGPEGESHVLFGAQVMYVLFGEPWWAFCAYHSRFWAKKCNRHFSSLCVADKYAFCLTPRWLYLPMVNWSGEIHEYMNKADDGKYRNANIDTASQRTWFDGVKKYMRAWVEEHKDGRQDTWTPEAA